MKTHDLAKALIVLADVLRSAPNQPLEDLTHVTSHRRPPDPNNLPMALSTLVALSDYDKQQWINLTKEYEFPIEVGPRHSSRDVIGKLLKHLERDPEARKRLTSAATHRERGRTSPELVKALQLLLKS
jgi:hypothetical protein